MRGARDTGILAHAQGFNDLERKTSALRLLRSLPRDSVVIPVQVLGEIFHVLVRKARPLPQEVHNWFWAGATVCGCADHR